MEEEDHMRSFILVKTMCCGPSFDPVSSERQEQRRLEMVPMIHMIIYTGRKSANIFKRNSLLYFGLAAIP